MRVALGFLLGTVLNRFSTQGRRLLRRSAPRNDKPSVIASAAKRSPHSRRLPRPCGPRNRGDCFGPAALAMTGGAAALAMTAYRSLRAPKGRGNLLKPDTSSVTAPEYLPTAILWQNHDKS